MKEKAAVYAVKTLYAMSSEKKNKTYDNYVPVWEGIPASLSWQIAKRNDQQFGFLEEKLQDIRTGINLGVILNSVVMIEGYLKNKSVVMLYGVSSNIEGGQRKDYRFKILKSKFVRLNKIVNKITGQTIEGITRNDKGIWKEIGTFYKFRNTLAHGQSLETLIDPARGSKTVTHAEFQGDHKEIHEYFVQKGLDKTDLSEGIPFKEALLSDSKADFIFNRCKEFIVEFESGAATIGFPRLHKVEAALVPFIR